MRKVDNQLKNLRKLSGLSVKQTAEKLGVSVKEFKFLEKEFGKGSIPSDTVETIKTMFTEAGLSELSVSLLGQRKSVDLGVLSDPTVKFASGPQEFPSDDVQYRKNVQWFLYQINRNILG